MSKELSDEINTVNSIDVRIDYGDYKKIVRLFPSKVFSKFFAVFLIIAILDIMILIPDPELEPLTFFDIVMIDITLLILSFSIIILYNLITREIKYKKLVKQSIDNVEYIVDIYDDYLVKRGKNITQKVMFADIKKYKETSDKLYLKIDKNNVIPLPKAKMTLKKIDFIKHSVDTCNKKNNNYDYQLKKKDKIKNDKEPIRSILIILFIITLLTPWIAICVISMAFAVNSVSGFYIFKSSWAALLVLPIPLSSLILGIIYKIKGMNCLKNIIAGGIMIFILLFISSTLQIEEDDEVDYSAIEPYVNIIKIKLPKESIYMQTKPEEGHSSNLISSAIIFKNQKEADIFYQDVINSEYWILEDDISTTLSNFGPSNMVCHSTNNDCYYSVFILYVGYNTVPNESGTYHTVSMLYDPDIKELFIDDFNFAYKN